MKTDNLYYVAVAVLFLGALFAVIFFTRPNHEKAPVSAGINDSANDFGLRYAKPDEDKDSYMLSQMEKCFYGGGSMTCYNLVADIFMEQFHLGDVLDFFERSQEEMAVFSQCHAASHFLGRAEYTKTGSSMEAFSTCSSACHGGCYHGVMEQYFWEEGLAGAPTETVLETIASACGSRSDYDIPALHSECMHGIGHAVMFITDNDLFQSLEFCDALPGAGERESCYGGVFMENSSSSTDNSPHVPRYIKEDDPMYPCNALEERYLQTCYRYQSSFFYISSGNDWQKTIDLCNRVPQRYRNGCFHIVGTNQVGSYQDPARMYANCNLVGSAYKRDCIFGVMDALVARYGGDIARADAFCSLVSEDEKPLCYEAMGYMLLGWTGSEKEVKDKCLSISEKEFIDNCHILNEDTN